jgi:hypothetical protein
MSFDIQRFPLQKIGLSLKMASLVINGSMNSDSIEIRDHVVQFYKRLYAEQFVLQPNLDGLSFLPINADERN